jgi:hypothetical protein
MKRRFRKGGYTSDQIDGTDEVSGLAELAWSYIKSNTFEALETNRERLIAALQPKDRIYIKETWQPKESRVVYAYTRLYPNLGCHSSQRGESYHVVMKQVTNGQLSLEESCRRLIRKILDILKELSMDEDRAQADTAILLDKHAFSYLTGTVSLDALKRIDAEWQQVTQLANQDIDLGLCECELLYRYGLPCKHHLLRAARSGEPLPRVLLHPRWWLHGPAIQQLDWQPSYGEEQVVVMSPPRRTLMASTHSLLEFRDTLQAEERSRLDARILHTHEALLAAAQEAREISELPLLPPDAVRKREWVKKKTHGKADARGLTGAEIAGRALKGKERKERAALNTPCPIGLSQGDCIEVLGSPQVDSLESRSPTPDAPELPASTAPARLQQEDVGVGGKRKRTVTNAYIEARYAGLPSLGYSQ